MFQPPDMVIPRAVFVVRNSREDVSIFVLEQKNKNDANVNDNENVNVNDN